MPTRRRRCTSERARLPSTRSFRGRDRHRIPANRWRTVLVAGDNSSPAFDNGIETLRERLRRWACATSRATRPTPARAGADRLCELGQCRSAPCAAAGGQACLVYHDEPRRRETASSCGPTAGCCRRPTLDRALSEGCGSVPTVVIVSACHSGTFIDAGDAPAQSRHPDGGRDRPHQLRLRRQRRLHLLRPVLPAAVRRGIDLERPRAGDAGLRRALERRLGVRQQSGRSSSSARPSPTSACRGGETCSPSSRAAPSGRTCRLPWLVRPRSSKRCLPPITATKSQVTWWGRSRASDSV